MMSEEAAVGVVTRSSMQYSRQCSIIAVREIRSAEEDILDTLHSGDVTLGGDKSNDSSSSSEIPEAPNEPTCSEKSHGLLTIGANLSWKINQSKRIMTL